MPHILTADVMHKRLFPRENGFVYKAYYLCLPLEHRDYAPLPVNRFGAMSFFEKDHGSRDGKSCADWARNILQDAGCAHDIATIELITMPRLFGYVFNPVSFYLCRDKDAALRAVICEVNNTFGETHSYLCRHEDGRAISQDDILTADKLFHVSPFLHREGHYTFRFADKPEKTGIWIDFYDGGGKKKLVTSVIGHKEPLTEKSMRKARRKVPFLTAKVVFLIHYQALKLLWKKIRYVPKPQQKEIKVSQSPAKKPPLTKN